MQLVKLKSCKEVFIKLGAQSLPAYTSVFKQPLGLCDDLNQLIKNYYWGSEKGKRKTRRKACDHLLKPKSLGGIGFQDFWLFNQALLAREAWRLIAFPDSLCARVLKAKYFPSGNLEDTVFTENPSATWQGIEHGLQLLKKGLIW